jgi:hypothetical protein
LGCLARHHLETHRRGIRVSRDLWKVLLAIGCAALPLYALQLSPPCESALLQGFSLLATTAVAVGLRTYHPQPYAAWCFFGAGQALNTIGNWFYVRTYYLGVQATLPGASLVAFTLGLTCFLIGLATFFLNFRNLVGRDAFR